MGEPSVSYTGRELFYESTGISLSIPAAPCEKAVGISVEVVYDDYILPSGYSNMPVVSDMFQITASDTLPAPVTVRMEHCGVVEEKNSLVHIIAHGSPPYQFKLLYGGRFPLHRSYAEVQMKKFSILAILAHKLGWRMSLSMQVFYQRNNTVTFVATKNIQSHLRAIKEKYAGAVDTSEMSMLCDYTSNAITLNIPTEPQAGWAIEPKFQPTQILTTLIREYRPGRTPPSVELDIRWMGEGEPRAKNVKIGIKGCSIESFTLSCNPSHMPTALHPIGPLPVLALSQGQPSYPPSLQSTASSDTSQFHTPPVPEGIIILFSSSPSSVKHAYSTASNRTATSCTLAPRVSPITSVTCSFRHISISHSTSTSGTRRYCSFYCFSLMPNTYLLCSYHTTQ